MQDIAEALGTPKMIFILLTSAPIAGLIQFAQDTWSANEKIIYGIAFLAFADTFLGLVVAIKEKEVDLSKFSELFIKIIIYGLVVFVTYLATFVEGLTIVYTVSCALIYAREIASVLIHIEKLKPGTVHPAILKYLKDFDSKTGEIVKDYEKAA